MPLTNAIRVYAAALATLFVLDLLWLGVFAKEFYQRELAEILRPDVQWRPAVAFYCLFVLGLVVFVIAPAIERGSLARAVGMGAFFGLVAYATYDLTNLALAKDFPPIVAAVDLLWGAFLTAAVSGVGYLARG